MSHESSLIGGLVKKIKAIVDEQDADRVTKVCIKLGALSQISAGHFREHFETETVGTLAEGAALEVETCADMDDPDAQSIVLQSIDVAEE